MKPLVSIVCESYNHESYLRQCLEGFVMQKTDFSFEILIHDDASIDKSVDIIREYEYKYPNLLKPIYQIENQYSKGVKIWSEIQFPRALGKYIAICEGDDYWIDPQKLQKQVDYLESHPECTLCFHNTYITDERKEAEFSLFASIENRDYAPHELLNSLLTQTSSCVFRTTLAESFRISFGKCRMAFCDTPLVLLCAKYGSVHGMKDVMSVYRRHPGGWTATYNADKLYRIGRTWENVRFALSGTLYSELTDKITTSYLQALSHAYREEKNIRIVWLSFYRGVIRQPLRGIKALIANAKNRKKRLGDCYGKKG